MEREGGERGGCSPPPRQPRCGCGSDALTERFGHNDIDIRHRNAHFNRELNGSVTFPFTRMIVPSGGREPLSRTKSLQSPAPLPEKDRTRGDHSFEPDGHERHGDRGGTGSRKAAPDSRRRAEVFFERGFDAASMGDIARAAAASRKARSMSILKTRRTCSVPSCSANAMRPRSACSCWMRPSRTWKPR